MQTIQCPKCQQSLEVENPSLAIMNHENVSFLLGTHEHGITCVSCSTYLKPAMLNVQGVQWQWIECERPVGENGNRLIVPPGLSLVPH